MICRPDATRCLEQAETSQASACTREGFGWSYTLPGMCDVCGRNFFSTRVVSSNGLVSFNRCEECPQQFYTSDIGMSACLRCPDFHVRKPGDAACTLCAAGILCVRSPHALSVAFFPCVHASSIVHVCIDFWCLGTCMRVTLGWTAKSTGTQVDPTGMQCAPCPQHSINPGGCLACTNCSLQHYTDAVNHAGQCLACPGGTIRQQSSNYSRCEPCPRFYSVSHATQQCQLCVLPANLRCPGEVIGSTYIDDCSVVDGNTQTGCICGCRQCALHPYSGVVPNFILLPGCRPGCSEGYKLRHHSDGSILCVRTYVVLREPEFELFNNGFYKLSNLDSTDLTVRLCHDFFSLSLSQLEAFLHLTPSLPTHADAEFIRVQDSIMASYITDPRELANIDESCSFRCLIGYIAMPSLETRTFECVPQARTSTLATMEPCATVSQSFALSSCATQNF